MTTLRPVALALAAICSASATEAARGFDEGVATGLERRDGVLGVGVGVARNRDRVGLGRLERLVEVGELRVAAAQLLVELGAGCGGTRHQADDLETG